MNRGEKWRAALPGIKAIHWCSSDNINPDRNEGSPYSGWGLELGRAWREVPCVVLSRCSLSTEVETAAGQSKYTTTLTIYFARAPDLPEQNLSFIVTQNNGERWLVGGAEWPRAAMKWTRSSGSEGKDASGVELKVTLECLHDLRPVISFGVIE